MYCRGKPPPGADRSPRKGAGENTPYQRIKREAKGAKSLDELKALVAGYPGANKLRLLHAIGGPPPRDPLEYMEQVEQMRLAAKQRPRRPPREGKPASEFSKMTTEQLVEEVERIVTGEVMPAAHENYPEPAKGYAEGERRLRAAGFEEVLTMLAEGQSQREVCSRLGVRQGHLNRWIDSMPDGRQRFKECRTMAAQAWLDRGLAVITEAKSLADLAKAREIAMMCKKYASISDPAFSDRVQVDTTVKTEDQASIDAKLRLIMSQVAQTKALKGDE